MKKTTLRTAALGTLLGAAGLAASMSTASAIPLSCGVISVCNVSIYNSQTLTNGLSTDAREQANAGNPLITAGDLVYSGTFTGNLDFNLESGSATIANFIATSGGSLSGSPTLNQTISSATFATTSVFVITGNFGGGVISGAISHDDGITLTSAGGGVSAAPPTSDESSSYSAVTGAWKLIYVEANGLPAVLDFEFTPLPPTWIMMLTALIGIGGFFAYRRRRANSLSAFAAA